MEGAVPHTWSSPGRRATGTPSPQYERKIACSMLKRQARETGGDRGLGRWDAWDLNNKVSDSAQIELSRLLFACF